MPALELIDARSYRVHPADGRTRTVRDTIADNAADAGIVVGTERIAPADAAAGALRWAGAICKRNGTVEETGLGAGVLDDPVQGVVWLANRLHGLGIPLAAGETILAGSFTRPIDCRPGDRFHADFGPLGALTLDGGGLMELPRNEFKRQLARPGVTFGLFSGLLDPAAAEVVAAAGFDWMLIDGEHAPHDLGSILAGSERRRRTTRRCSSVPRPATPC